MGNKRMILRKESMALLILVIMVLSIFGMWEASQPTEETYNGFKFTLTENGWSTVVKDQKLQFNYHPKDLEFFNSTQVSISGEKVYITFDPADYDIDTSPSINYIGSSLFQNNVRPVLACAKEENCPSEELPIVSCSDASADVIFIRSGNESKIFKQDMCYVIESQSSADLIALRERFVYQYLGVMS